MWTPLILAIILLLWLPFYIWTEYRWKEQSYFWTKAVSSLLFLSVAVTAFLILKPAADYALWIIIALVLGLIGDLFLVYVANIKYFILGLVSFLLGQLCYGVLFLRYVGFSWIDVMLYIVVIALALFVYARSNLELGKMKKPVLAYLLIISFMFVMAISTIYKGGFSPLVTIMIAVGALLFLVSDIALAFIRFSKKPHRYLRAIDLSLYYTAQVTLALTVVAIA
ncbi:MAG: lysoplasmalogenase [Clostridiales bacterium]|nr:lysoplasmalogenase [Clostridiales bacterium]